MDFRYVWIVWSAAFLLPWLVLWLLAPAVRPVMWRASLATMMFGLTEPLFVPEYWNPPSLFELAQRTGFDIESLVFSFAVGGTGTVLYDVLTRRRTEPLPAEERGRSRHRWHRAALAVPVLVFLALYGLPWNPIYPAVVALAAGAVATAFCRPDLASKTVVGGGILLGYYAAFVLALVGFAPGYIENVWNLPQLINVRPLGIPLQELIFGFTFGMYWTSVYEHLAWRGLQHAGSATSEPQPRRRAAEGWVREFLPDR